MSDADAAPQNLIAMLRLPQIRLRTLPRATNVRLRFIRVNGLSRAHQTFDMRGDGAGEPFEMIAAFENRDDAALGVPLGDLH
jgi:hypothetical protein